MSYLPSRVAEATYVVSGPRPVVLTPLLSGVLSLLLFASMAGAGPVPAPKVCFPFDGTALGRLADGQVVTPLQADGVAFAPGVRGQALNADAGIVLRYAAEYLPQRQGSVVMWVRLIREIDATDTWRFFFSDGTAWGPRGMPRFWMQNGGLRYDLDGGSRYLTHKPSQWVFGRWAQFVFTWDAAGRTELYCNARLKRVLTPQPWDAEPTDSFRIGSGLDIAGRTNLPALALIDDVAIYDCVLTAEQIDQTYRQMALPVVELHTLQDILPADASNVPIRLSNAGYGCAQGTLAWRDSCGGREQVSFELAGQAHQDIDVDASNIGSGLQRLMFEVHTAGIDLQETISLAVYIEPDDHAPDDAEMAWRPVAQIDCTETAPDTHVGALTVIDSPLGNYLQAGSELHDRFAYRFDLTEPDQLVRVTIRYPDDRSRAAGVACWGPPQEALGSGYMTGDDIPLSHTMLERSFMFFSQHRHVALVFQTEVANQPAAIAEVTVERTDPRFHPAATPSALRARQPRRIGLYWEDPIFARCFGIADSTSNAEFEHVLQRCLDYCAYVGLNAISYPACWCNNAIYDSDLHSGHPVGSRLHPGDYPQCMARRCSERGVRFTPSLNVWQLTAVTPYLRSVEEVVAGVPSVNCVDREGKVLTTTDLGQGYWTIGPILNALHPLVQQAVREVTMEVAQRCAEYDSFAGVDFLLWPGSPMKTGGVNSAELISSYDDYSVGEFAKSLGQTPPGAKGQADRFQRRYHWIVDAPQRKEAWITWRCARMTEFYRSVAAELAALKGGARLGIGIYGPSARQSQQHDDTGDYYRAQSLDIAALSRDENIIIKRFKHQLAQRWRSRFNMPRADDLNLENTPAYQTTLADCPRTGAILHQQYFESNIKAGPHLNFPAPLLSEPQAMVANWGIRVTEPLPAGRDYLRYFASAVANLDVQELTVGGYVLGTQGAEEELRDFARGFTALPAVRFDTIFRQDGILARERVADGTYWFYLLNLNPAPRSVALQIDDNSLCHADTGRALPLDQGCAVLTLAPYELLVFTSSATHPHLTILDVE